MIQARSRPFSLYCSKTFENRNIAIIDYRYYRKFIPKIYRFSKCRRGDILTFPCNCFRYTLAIRSFDLLFLIRYSNNRTNDARWFFQVTQTLIRSAVADIALGRRGDLFLRGGERLRSAIAVAHGHCCDRSARSLCSRGSLASPSPSPLSSSQRNC